MTFPTATWPLNNFYDPQQTTALFEAVPRRQSCRSFLSAPSTQQWNDLKQTAERVTLPGVRIAFGMCENSLFQPFFGLLMKFENVQRYAAIITTEQTPQNLVNAGISGEMLMLDAVSMGLGGVWVAGTFKRNKLDLPVNEGEAVVALIALGVPANPPTPPLKRKRKTFNSLFENDFQSAPVALREASRAVWAAPSAMNRQPWRMRYEPEKTMYLRTPTPSLDLGIATAHIVAAMGRTPAQYALSDDGTTVRVTLKP